ncbi:SH3 domain-containing protein [Flaviaesturariibacter amylovorans]|uniref:SH3b domain-containing protein n=1 Tax=Flaviaesturariibacter amylovorans TaxID=1084520 RepID=A0ABP8GVV2_9BACT
MALQDKYSALVQAAQQAGVRNLQVREQNSVLYIDGEAPTGQVKDQLWSVYNSIDPDYRSGDLILNVNVGADAAGKRARVTTQESNLNVRKGPGTDQEIIGKAAHEDYVTLISKANEQWWLVRTSSGVEGYAAAQYLSAE